MAVAVVRQAEWLLDGQAGMREKMGKWEAECEAYNLILLSASHAASVGRLALDKLRLGPSGSVVARACIESGTRALWLIYPADLWDREARWLTYLSNGAYNRERLARLYVDFGATSEQSEIAAQTREFIAAVAVQLPDGTEPPRKYPDLREALASMGHERKYILYAELSQQTHSTHYATGAYTRNLGTMKCWGEFTGPIDWFTPLASCWYFMKLPVTRLAELLGLPREQAMPASIETEYNSAHMALKAESS